MMAQVYNENHARNIYLDFPDNFELRIPVIQTQKSQKRVYLCRSTCRMSDCVEPALGAPSACGSTGVRADVIVAEIP